MSEILASQSENTLSLNGLLTKSSFKESAGSLLNQLNRLRLYQLCAVINEMRIAIAKK